MASSPAASAPPALFDDSFLSHRIQTAPGVEIHARCGGKGWWLQGVAWRCETCKSVEAGVPLKVLKVWQQQPIHSGLDEGAMVLVEAEAPEDSARGPHVLKVWGTGGDRPHTFTQVTFPD